MTVAGTAPVIVPATSDRFDDVTTLLGPKQPDKPACWCLSSRLATPEFNRLRETGRPERLQEMCEQTPAPGLLAYTDDAVVGWCGFGPRPNMERLLRSRTIPRLDPPDTWCIVCFVVTPGQRRKGVAHHLLQATVDYARQHNAPAVEGYPIDTAGQRVSGAFAYVGTTSMFERAGFQRIGDADAHSAKLRRVIMRHNLTST